VFRGSVAIAVAISLSHSLALPMGTTYDGFVYLDLADVLGSERFPDDWHYARTPLFPLALKGAMAILGRQPNSVILLLSALGLAAVLVVGWMARSLVGPLGGAAVVILLSCDPTSIGYQHLVLTETGSALLLAAIAALTLWTPGGTWRRCSALVCALTVAYYWRQSLASVMPLAAGLHLWPRSSAEGAPRARASLALLQAALILGLPLALAQPWKRYTDDATATAITIRQGLLRQALLPVDHPIAAPHADVYRQAIADAGNLRSGLRAHALYDLCNRIYGTVPLTAPSARPLLLEAAAHDPIAYLRAVGRTLTLYGGARALESENMLHRQLIFELPPAEYRFDGAPGEKLDRIRADFGFPARDSYVLHRIRALAERYDRMIVLGSLMTVGGLIAGILLRQRSLAVVCAFPVAYVIPPASVLASIDRYALPAYPLVLANIVLVPILVGREIARRRRGGG
jgi:hypothetical protein